ncbi:MAG: LppX_LprAFG lipoprotein [Actinomycetia bacterium]|nr:LppX_LprAFG lipoprotein [Actinomycetes bacterium]
MRRFLAILFTVVLLAAACGGSDEDSVSADAVGSDSSDSGSDEGDTSGSDTSDDSGSDDSGSGDLADDTEFGDLIRDSVAATAEITTGRMAATMTMEGGSEFPTPAEVLLSGEFDFPNDAVALEMDLSGMAEAMADSDDPDAALAGSFFDEPVEVIRIGETSWLKMGLLAMLAGGDVEWIELTSDEFTAAEQLLPGGTGAFDPQDFIAFLNGADDIQELGTEDIRGIETTRYAGTITEEKLADFDVDGALDSVGATEEIPFEVWVDGDGLIRRLLMEVTDTGDGSSMTLDWEMYDFGDAIDIAPPPADQVTSADALSGLLGG